MKNHADDMQTMQTDKSWWMTSQMSHEKQSHKSLAQITCTNHLHKSITQDRMTS